MANENNVKSSSGNLPFYLRPLVTVQTQESHHVVYPLKRPQRILERQGTCYVSHVQPEQIAHNLRYYEFSVRKDSFLFSYYKKKRFDNVLKIPISLYESNRFLKLVNAMPWRSRSAVMECYGIIFTDSQQHLEWQEMLNGNRPALDELSKNLNVRFFVLQNEIEEP